MINLMSKVANYGLIILTILTLGGPLVWLRWLKKPMKPLGMLKKPLEYQMGQITHYVVICGY